MPKNNNLQPIIVRPSPITYIRYKHLKERVIFS